MMPLLVEEDIYDFLRVPVHVAIVL
jgi:hypothetical protein